MSANFWTSSHCLRWLVDEAAMKAANADRAAQEQGQLSAAGLSRLREYFVETVQMLGKKILRRSAVIATAIVYFKRFYLKTSFTEFDPILMVPTAVYLAAKVEEHHVRVMDVISAYKKLAMGQGAPRKALATGGGRSRVPGLLARHVLEAEKVLLQRLDFDLVVFHPYGPLEALMADMGERVQQSCLQIAWTVVNDSYHTDVCLLFPPFMIALSAIYISCVYVEYDIKQWLNKLHVNEDPLVFSHRFEHFDPDEPEKLIYYQYEAKRHANVTVLSAEHVAKCTMTTNSAGNHTTIRLALPHDKASKLAIDKVLVLSSGCEVRGWHAPSDMSLPRAAWVVSFRTPSRRLSSVVAGCRRHHQALSRRGAGPISHLIRQGHVDRRRRDLRARAVPLSRASGAH